MNPHIAELYLAELAKHREDGSWGSSINPHMNKDNDRGRFKVVIRILRPLVRSLLEWGNEHEEEFPERLNHVDDVIEKFDQKFEQQSLSSCSLNNLKSIEDDTGFILFLCDEVSRSLTWTTMITRLGHLVRFIDSLLKILQDIYNNQYAEEEGLIDMFIPVKKQILYVHDELKFLGNFLWIINLNPLKYFYFMYSAQAIPVKLSCLLYYYLMSDQMDDDELIRDFKESIYAIQTEIKASLNKSRESSLENDIGDVDTAYMDERVVGFFGTLIDELRKILSHNWTSFMAVADVKDQIEILADELSFLRCNLLDIIMLYLHEEEESLVKEMKSLCVSTQILIMDTGYVIYFSRPNDEEEKEKERANYWRFHLPDLLEAVDSLKQQANDVLSSSYKFFSLSRKFSSSSSSTNQMGCVDFLIKNLEQLMHSEPLKHQAQTVYQETVSMRKCLFEITADEQFVKSNLEMEFEQAAYQSSNIIDSFLAREGPLWYHKLGMFVVANDVKIMHGNINKALLKKMIASESVICSVSCPESSLANNILKHTNPTVGSKDEIKDMNMEKSTDVLVGVKDAVKEVMGLLTSNGATPLKIISIVGMPGLGKTTLANAVYKHPSINLHFHVCAWCCASQTYVKDALLLEMVNQIVGKTNQSIEINGEDCAQKLYQNLKGRKYLIVIDDVWDIELWKQMKDIFPDDHNGSRILFTTRHRAVALEAKSIPYSLRLLSIEESCELLWFKVFDGETIPQELSFISKRIARNCKGLPLAVVLIAGILKKAEMSKDSWRQVAETVMSLRRTHVEHFDTMNFTKILEFSYKNLPDFLKPCFLYFGAFPEDTTISVSKLIRLWISEGFVQEESYLVGQKSLEQEAEEYLNELINRSLVMIARRSSKGGIKTCRVHDILHEFCLAKFKKERFVSKSENFGGILFLHGNSHMQIHSSLYHYRSDRAKYSCQLDFQEDSTSTSGSRQETSERIVFREKPPIVREEQTERVVVMGTKINQTRCLDYGLISSYKLLRVLDVGTVRVESSADTSDLVMIAKLVHLKYLAIRPRRTEIPLEIGNLQNLETLILSGVIGHIMLPESVWNLASLRHVETDYGFFNFQHCSKQFFENFSQLNYFESISILPLQCGNDVEKFILRRLPGIKKLSCRFFADSWDDSTGSSLFPALDFLNELESLNLFFSGKVQCPCKFSFPSNLKKLSMSNSRLPWDEISVIGRLPNLEVLKLLNKSFEGQQWDMRDGEFPKLKFLKLESLDIELWNAFAPEHLPFLEQLVVLNCQQLEEINSSFGELSTLELIEIKWCSSSATDSVKKILQIQREMSNDQFIVTLVSSA